MTILVGVKGKMRWTKTDKAMMRYIGRSYKYFDKPIEKLTKTQNMHLYYSLPAYERKLIQAYGAYGRKKKRK
jgi:hypothetical protein